MATLNSFIRSTSAAIKRAERAQNRRAAEASRLYKQQQKAQDIQHAGQAVLQYNDYISILKSVHREASENIEWSAIANETPPVAPTLNNQHEVEAIAKMNKYKPSVLDRVFGSTKKKVAKLEANILTAKQKDEAKFEEQKKVFEKDYQEWQKLQVIAKGVLAKDIVAYKEVIEYFQPFAEISTLGSRLTLNVFPSYAEVQLFVNSKEVIPDYVLSQTSTGKLSKKSMPVSKFNELYQDYVCSCVLRVTRETLAYLPINFVIVHAMGEILKTSTGKLEEEAILSIAVFPETMNKLNLDNIDPSDSMINFVHQMKFSKTNGFMPVERLTGEMFS